MWRGTGRLTLWEDQFKPVEQRWLPLLCCMSCHGARRCHVWKLNTLEEVLWGRLILFFQSLFIRMGLDRRTRLPALLELHLLCLLPTLWPTLWLEILLSPHHPVFLVTVGALLAVGCPDPFQ